ncbi:MAG: hypothetical protein Q7K57_40155 [Burkholderiaceae bacterium]|nr:hypothetical protein [Burkholderiaceae bacterium]
MKSQKMSPQVEKPSCLNFYELEKLCDDPQRNETKQEVYANLTPTRFGFALTARDGDRIYKIVDERGRQIKFRSLDRAMERLSDVPYLYSEPEIH